jgi:hypothetical protein
MTESLEDDGRTPRREVGGLTREQAAEIRAREQRDRFMRRKYQQMFGDRLLAADIIEADLGIDILHGAYPKQASDGGDGPPPPSDRS